MDQFSISEDSLSQLVPSMIEQETANNWIFETIRPFTNGRTLEIGSGNGEISNLFIQNDMPIHLSDPDQGNRSRLREKYEGNRLVRVHSVDLNNPDFKEKYQPILGEFGTVFKLNNTVHITIDPITIENASLLLREKGILMLLFPATTTLYNGLSESLDALKEYNRRHIGDLIRNHFDILKIRFICLEGGLSSLIIVQKPEENVKIKRKYHS